MRTSVYKTAEHFIMHPPFFTIVPREIRIDLKLDPAENSLKVLLLTEIKIHKY